MMERLKHTQMRDSTVKMYYSVWKHFNKFLVNLDFMPKSWEDRATLFVTYLIEYKQTQSSTIKSYISAIKRTLIDDNYDWNDNQVLLTSLTKACHLTNDRVTTRLPITCTMLEFILFELERVFSTQPYLQILYKTLFALGYYGLMRIGELTDSPHVVKACNVYLSVNKEKLLIILYTSKTHGYESLPQRINISSNTTEKTGNYAHRHFCPFQLIDQYIKARGNTYASEEEALFVFRDGSPVKAKQAREVLKTAIAALNLDARLYNTHSLRYGRTGDLIKYGYSIDEVQRMGRWRSTTVYKYIRY